MYLLMESKYYTISAFHIRSLLTIVNLYNYFYSNRHIGGLFTGNEKYPGLAGLKESGELEQMLNN